MPGKTSAVDNAPLLKQTSSADKDHALPHSPRTFPDTTCILTATIPGDQIILEYQPTMDTHDDPPQGSLDHALNVLSLRFRVMMFALLDFVPAIFNPFVDIQLAFQALFVETLLAFQALFVEIQLAFQALFIDVWIAIVQLHIAYARFCRALLRVCTIALHTLKRHFWRQLQKHLSPARLYNYLTAHPTLHHMMYLFDNYMQANHASIITGNWYHSVLALTTALTIMLGIPRSKNALARGSTRFFIALPSMLYNGFWGTLVFIVANAIYESKYDLCNILSILFIVAYDTNFFIALKTFRTFLRAIDMSICVYGKIVGGVHNDIGESFCANMAICIMASLCGLVAVVVVFVMELLCLAVWRRFFEPVGADFGLEFDPSSQSGVVLDEDVDVEEAAFEPKVEDLPSLHKDEVDADIKGSDTDSSTNDNTSYEDEEEEQDVETKKTDTDSSAGLSYPHEEEEEEEEEEKDVEAKETDSDSSTGLSFPHEDVETEEAYTGSLTGMFYPHEDAEIKEANTESSTELPYPHEEEEEKKDVETKDAVTDWLTGLAFPHEDEEADMDVDPKEAGIEPRTEDLPSPHKDEEEEQDAEPEAAVTNLSTSLPFPHEDEEEKDAETKEAITVPSTDLPSPHQGSEEDIDTTRDNDEGLAAWANILKEKMENNRQRTVGGAMGRRRSGRR